MMTGLSLWEPWASAMRLGIKENETRSWKTHFRGDLVICASRRALDDDSRFVLSHFVAPAAPDGYKLPFGCAVAVVEVFDCVPTLSIVSSLSPIESELGNYGPCRFAWRTRNLRVLSEPVPVKGSQGFFRIPPDAANAIATQLALLGSPLAVAPAPPSDPQEEQLALF